MQKLYNEGRVQGLSAYELYLRQYIAEGNDPSTAPTEKEWLSMTMLNGNSMILKVNPTSVSQEDTMFYMDIPLPYNTVLRANTTIYAYCFLGECETNDTNSKYGWATKITDSGYVLANTDTKHPANHPVSIDDETYPDNIDPSTLDTYLARISQYGKIIDGGILQLGEWKETGSTPYKDLLPDVDKTPVVRLIFSEPITETVYILLEGFRDRHIIDIGSDLSGSTETRFPQDGDFIGPQVFPWLCKIMFTVPNAYALYLKKLIEADLDNYMVKGVDYVTAGENPNQPIGDRASANGVNVSAIGVGSSAEGHDTISRGVYSHAEGVNTEANGAGSHAEGYTTKAVGDYSHSEGFTTKASTLYGHAEGENSIADAQGSHAEGYTTKANGKYSHSEGYNTIASADNSHAEGDGTRSVGINSHAEGIGSSASGMNAHAEGELTVASGKDSHAEGYGTEANKDYSHAEGESSKASGKSAHAEGKSNAQGEYSHSEGCDTVAQGKYSHAEGYESQAIGQYSYASGIRTKANGEATHTEGYYTEASDRYSHAEGNRSKAIGEESHAEGDNCTATGNHSHAECYYTDANGNESHAEGSGTNADGQASHAEGSIGRASGFASHVEGYYTKAIGSCAHAEGDETTAEGIDSHAEGMNTLAQGNYSHAEGLVEDSEARLGIGALAGASHVEGTACTASGVSSHAEGDHSKATGNAAHAEGNHTTAGNSAHAEGYSTTASGNNSHAEGNHTKAASENQHVEGKYNVPDTQGTYAHIIGGGTDDSHRKNIATVDWQGNAMFAGNLQLADPNADLVMGNISMRNVLDMLTIHELPAAPSEVIFDGNDYNRNYEVHIRTVIDLAVQLQRINIITKQYLWANKKNLAPWYPQETAGITTVPFTNKDLSTIDVSSAQIYHLDTACSDNQTYTVTSGRSSRNITYSYTYSYDPSASVADTFNVKMSGEAYLYVNVDEHIGTSAENAVERIYKYEFTPTYE